MEHTSIKHKLLTPWSLFLVLVIAVGAVALVLRMTQGLGATTNLTDTWAWGLWKGFNVLVLIAFGAGGFTSAALIYLFGGEKYHAWALPTALWGLLCYSFAGASLMVDIGIPWRIINPIWMWPEHSILFEVAWCVMLYITVLALEVAPSIFQRFGWDRLAGTWRGLVPWYAVAGLTFFTYAMSHSFVWAGAALVLFTAVNLMISTVRNKPSTPALLIMFGVILSINHQSSLGSLFLLMPEKLSHFWWSPRLPFNFLLSAVAGGFAMLLVERTITCKLYDRARPDHLMAALARILVGALWLYVGFRVLDVLAVAASSEEFGGVAVAFGGSGKATLFVVEMFLGFFVPALLLTSRTLRQHRRIRFVAAAMVVLGVAFNRLNVTFIGMNLEGTYVPIWQEVSISAATLAAILFLFFLGIKLLPVYQVRDEPEVTGATGTGPGMVVSAPAAPANKI